MAGKKILITGVSGLLGSNCAFAYRDRNRVCGLYREHRVAMPGVRALWCDLLDKKAVRRLAEEEAPDIVVHCAALTNIDACEREPEKAQSANVDATASLVEALAPGTRLVYVSTDAVYAGEGGPFTEDSPCRPVNVYARTKLEGERVALAHPGTLVLRTNIFGWNIIEKTSIAEWVTQSVGAGKPIDGFTDVLFSSIYTLRLAWLLEGALEKNLTGVYNCASSTSLSKYDFAVRLCRAFGFDTSLVRPVPVEHHGFAAPRGRDLRLDTGKLRAALGIRIPTIEESIEEFRSDHLAGIPARIKAAQPEEGEVDR